MVDLCELDSKYIPILSKTVFSANDYLILLLVDEQVQGIFSVIFIVDELSFSNGHVPGL